MVAPLCVYELAVDAEADVTARKIVPYESGGRIVDVRQVVIEGIFVRVLSLKVRFFRCSRW